MQILCGGRPSDSAIGTAHGDACRSLDLVVVASLASTVIRIRSPVRHSRGPAAEAPEPDLGALQLGHHGGVVAGGVGRAA
jgi:hypothetical protein